MLQSPGSERSIWLRDNRATALSTEVVERPGRAAEFARIRLLYDAYDHLVSPSPALDPLNPTSLVEEVAAQKFSSAASLIGGQRILAAAALPLQFDDGDSPPPDWLTQTSSSGEIRIFASLGRLSVENNHLRLIRAFSLVHAAVPGSRLLVIGEGALAATLAAEIVSLGLTDAVWLTGYRANPFALMRRSECFVFVGSDTRDPRALLEARVLGLPSVAVSSEPPVTVPQRGVIEVAAADRAIADGMLQFLDGRLGASSVDWVAHDDAAIGMFYRAVGVLRAE